MADIKFVTYEQFGAKGDGVTDDFAALYRAHEYANENKLPVVARDGAEYYLHSPVVDGEVKEIIIKTSTNFGNAHFIIDDRDISTFKDSETYTWYNKAIFKVLPYEESTRITDREVLDAVIEAGINRSSTRVALKFDYPVMIIPYNEAHKVYRRRGYGGWGGTAMHEVIVLDKDGNISDETPVMFDYNHIDYIDVYRLDIEPLLLEGGTFTTRATNHNTLVKNEDGTYTNYGAYLHRGFNIKRSYTTLRGVKHYITDEKPMRDQVDENGEVVYISPCYQGFYLASYANHVFFEDCVLSGRRCYNYRTGGAGGTYGLSGNAVNKLVFKGCRQANFWVIVDENGDIKPATEDTPGALTSMSGYTVNGRGLMMHWGIGGSNFCKNMEYIDCQLSRYDAHMGLYNGKIVNSTINGMEIVGMGNLLLENSRWFARGKAKRAGAGNALFYLRNDYASTWEGELTVKGFKAYVEPEACTYLLCHTYANWYYGYQAYFPNVSVEGLRLFDLNTREPLDSDHKLYLVGQSVLIEPALHLSKTVNSPAIFPDVDADGDGFVDGTKIPYDDVVSKTGVVDPDNFTNHNPIMPPDYIKYVRTEGMCELLIPDTSVYDNGGFFAKTEFKNATESYVGTGKASGSDDFSFKPIAELIME